MSDLLVYSTTELEHLERLKTVLVRLKKENYMHLQKVSIIMEETDFIGMLVGRSGIRYNREMVEVIGKWPIPETVTEL